MKHSDALIMIDSIRRSGYKPTAWESEFLRYIELSGYETLSYKQHRAMETIYAKSAGGGNYQARERHKR